MKAVFPKIVFKFRPACQTPNLVLSFYAPFWLSLHINNELLIGGVAKIKKCLEAVYVVLHVLLLILVFIFVIVEYKIFIFML